MTIAIRVDDVQVRYGSIVALDGCTLEIPAGVSVAVIGPNGSGKSTLLKAIAGLIRPTRGTIDVGGRSVSIVLQSTEVDRSLPLTVRDTVSTARYAQLGLLRRFGAADREAVDRAVARLDLQSVVGRQIHHLSGGQRQRAFVAQGLAQEADIVLLDEPLTGLDVVSRSLIDEALDGERDAGRTTVMTTHSFTEANACDLVALLSTRCIAFGRPATVLTEANLQLAFGGGFVRVGNTLVLDDPHHEHSHAH